MIKHLLIVIILFISSSIIAQNIHIVDMQGHEAVSDVFVITPFETAITNANGKVSLSHELSTTDSITFQHPSFITIKVSFASIAENKYQIILTRQTIALDEFTISANKWKQKADEMPLRVKSVHRDGLAYQPATSADLLGNTGQVFIQKSQQGGGSPMFRGFAANRILLVYDGMRVNNAIYRSGNLQNIILFDSKAMESAEIVFGPGSTVYGSDALGGVIDFRSIEPKFSNDSTLLINGIGSFGYGSAAKEGSGHVHFSLGGEKYSSFTSFSFSQFGDLTMGKNGPDEYLRTHYVDRINGKDTLINNPNDREQLFSGYKQMNFIQKFGIKLSDKTNMGIHFSMAQTSDVPRYDRLIQEGDQGLKYSEWYYGPNNWINAGITMQGESSTSLFDEWKLNLDYQNYKESRHDRRFDEIEKRHRTETVNGINFNIDFNKDINENLQMYYGAELWYNLIGSEGYIENIESGDKSGTSTRYPDGSDYLSSGIYSMIKWKISPNWLLNGGLRFSYVHMKGDFDTTYFPFPESSFLQSVNALTPSLGTVVKVSDKLRFQANIAQGFRAPNIDDVAKVFDSTPGNIVVPNTSLDPEKVWSFDLGTTWSPSNNFQWEVSGFYSLLEDVMVRSDYSINGQDSIFYDGELSKVEAIQNLGDGWIYGVESSIKLSFNTHFNVRGTFVYTKGEDGNSDPLRHVTPLMSSLHLVYVNNHFRVDVNGSYNAEVSNDHLAPSEQEKAHIYAIDPQGNPYSPSWYVLNVQGSWFISSALRLDLGLENILNERYRPYSSGITAAGMNLRASIIAHF